MSVQNKLFVTEEEEEIVEHITKKSREPEDVEMTIDVDDDNDPVVEEIPLNIAGNGRHLQVFQYASRPRRVAGKAAKQPFIAAVRYKSNSSVWELDIPLDEQTFFNKDKAEADWDGVNIQTLKGVGVDNEGQYAAFVSDGQAYLIPVEKVAQLKPFFKYIDHANQQKRQEDAKQNVNPSSQRAHVITMSVKSVNDQTQNRLTGSLMAHKVADEESSVDMDWIDNTFEEFKDGMVKETDQHKLRPVKNDKDYLFDRL